MDGIREQLVKRPSGSEDGIKKVIILVGAVVLAVLLFAAIYIFSNGILMPIAFLLAGLVIWGGWWLKEQLNVEYEYTVVGSDITIDKVINKSRRKNLCELSLRKAEGFYKAEKHLSGATEISACGDGEKYSIEFSDPSQGKVVLIFTPDEQTLEAIRPYLPRLI